MLSLTGREVSEMQGPWFGIALMVLMIAGLGAWIWYAMRSGKDDKSE